MSIAQWIVLGVVCAIVYAVGASFVWHVVWQWGIRHHPDRYNPNQPNHNWRENCVYCTLLWPLMPVWVIAYGIVWVGSRVHRGIGHVVKMVSGA